MKIKQNLHRVIYFMFLKQVQTTLGKNENNFSLSITKAILNINSTFKSGQNKTLCFYWYLTPLSTILGHLDCYWWLFIQSKSRLHLHVVIIIYKLTPRSILNRNIKFLLASQSLSLTIKYT